MAEKKRRFTSEELSLIKTLFADNEEFVLAVRKVMLQAELNASQKELINKLVTDTVFALIKKSFLPHIDSDAPMHQLAHLNMGLLSEIREKGVEEMAPQFDAKALEIKYIEQQLNVLKNINDVIETPIKLEELSVLSKELSAYDMYVNTVAFTFLLSYVDSILMQMTLLAGEKDETVEQTLARLEKDSTK
jgi:hypothetical protein